MIFYFSGTGNSRYVAGKLSEKLEERLKFIPDCLRDMPEFEGESLGLVFPVYSWGFPEMIEKFVKRLPEEFIQTVNAAGKSVWAVLTCGDETGMAPEMTQKLLKRHGLEASGMWSIIMPNNYVLLPGFDVDNKSVESSKLEKAPARIDKIASDILSGNMIFDLFHGPWPRLKSYTVYPLFRNWGIFPKKWHSDSKCISCGVCASKCPMKNIAMADGKPHWGINCVSCLACYHYCPVKSVGYGKMTNKKGQYHFPGKR